jgi:hypothetical protein
MTLTRAGLVLRKKMDRCRVEKKMLNGRMTNANATEIPYTAIPAAQLT